MWARNSSCESFERDEREGLRLTFDASLFLSQDCFVHVYGPLPEANKYGVVRKPQSFGVCGVCRKPMKVGEDGGAGNGGGGKSSSEAPIRSSHHSSES